MENNNFLPPGYPVAVDTVEVTLEVKKSRFIAHALPVGDREQAVEELAKLRRQYPDARHYCWAYVLGDPGGSCSAAMSDDGEPAGTAGKPLLNVLRHKGIGDVMVVVVRYFGGIKLGAGGLTRAYSSAAEAVMSAVSCKCNEPMLSVVVRCDFAVEQLLRHWADSRDVVIGRVSYTDQVQLDVSLPYRMKDELRRFCRQHAMTLELPQG